MEKKKVLMIESYKGSEYGNVTVLFEAGETYMIAPELADVFVREIKCGKYVLPEKIVQEKVAPVEPVQKIRPEERPEDKKPIGKMLPKKSKNWQGVMVRETRTGMTEKIKRVNHGWVTFESGTTSRTTHIRKGWEVV